MCNVLVDSNRTFRTEGEKKKFQESKRLEIIKKVQNPIILFVYAGDKNAAKTRKRYLKEHPRAIEWEVLETV